MKVRNRVLECYVESIMLYDCESLNADYNTSGELAGGGDVGYERKIANIMDWQNN